MKKSFIMSCRLSEIELVTGVETLIVSDRVSPGNSFQPFGFSLAPETAKDLLILDIKVGKNSQLVSSGGIPGTLFSESNNPIRVRMDTVRSGTGMSLVVVNKGPTIPFIGKVIGDFKNIGGSHIPLMFGFGETKVAPGRLVTIRETTQVEIEPCNLHVPPHQLEDFDIVFIKGERFLGEDLESEVPASMLEKDQFIKSGGNIRLKPLAKVGIGSCVTIGVFNRANIPLNFNAAIIGD